MFEEAMFEEARNPQAVVGELRSFVETLRREPLRELPDARIQEDFVELHRAMEQLEGERLRRLAEIDRRRPFERDGYLSTASWLVSSLQVAWGVAREQVRIARGLGAMDRTRRAFEAGTVSLSALRVLASAHQAEPVAFEAAESYLVEAARVHSVPDLQRAVAVWRAAAERAAEPDGEDPLLRRRHLHASMTFGGMVRVDGEIDPATGETLLTALHAVVDAEARTRLDDDRTPAQRRADALGEICHQWLDRGDRPTVAGERPHVTVTVAAEALRQSTSRRASIGAELDLVGAIDPGLARRLACDASLMRVVMGPRSEPLDVGRRTPVVPPAIRRALVVRDRRCRFPGCDRPFAWCDAHHVNHWADGGATALPNLVLLCRRHHGAVHSGGFDLTMIEEAPVFRRPDGSVLQDRAPP